LNLIRHSIGSQWSCCISGVDRAQERCCKMTLASACCAHWRRAMCLSGLPDRICLLVITAPHPKAYPFPNTQSVSNRPIFPELLQVTGKVTPIWPGPKSKLLGTVVSANQQHQSTEAWQCSWLQTAGCCRAVMVSHELSQNFTEVHREVFLLILLTERQDDKQIRQQQYNKHQTISYWHCKQYF